MTRNTVGFTMLAVLATVLPLAADPPQHKTAHFQIEHDSQTVEAETLGKCLESTYAAVLRWCHDVDIHAQPTSEALRVVLHDRFETFAEVLRQLIPGVDAVGLYVPQADTSHFCRLDRLPMIEALDHELAKRTPGAKTDSFRAQRENLVARLRQLVVAHEAAHQVLYNVGVLDRSRDYPFWWVEGLACQFETACNDPTAPDNALRAADLNPDDITVSAVRALIAASPIDEAAAPIEPTRYALAYLLVDVLRRQRSELLTRYLRAADADPRQDFESAFGPIDDGLVSAMRKRYETVHRQSAK